MGIFSSTFASAIPPQFITAINSVRLLHLLAHRRPDATQRSESPY